MYGGATEISLACHARLVSDSDKAKIALPEAALAFFLSWWHATCTALGQYTRCPTMMTTGQSLKAARAKSMGLINDVVPANKLISAAKKLITDGLDPVQPWDKKGLKRPVVRFTLSRCAALAACNRNSTS